MNMNLRLVSVMLLATLISAGDPVNTRAQAPSLVTLSSHAQLANVPGRSIATAREHHLIVDAPPPLGGPNEEINPIEMLLSSLATCGVLVSEKLAKEQGIPLQKATAMVEGDLDPRGVRGEGGDPRIQVFRVSLNLTGPTQAQAEMFSSAFKQRCPIYATLSRAAPIEIKVESRAD
jgi:uncharacterized OsmC-like protein